MFLAYIGPISTNYAPAYPSTFADNVHSFGYFQHNNAPSLKAQIISNWFPKHENDLTVLKWLPQSPDLYSVEHL